MPWVGRITPRVLLVPTGLVVTLNSFTLKNIEGDWEVLKTQLNVWKLVPALWLVDWQLQLKTRNTVDGLSSLLWLSNGIFLRSARELGWNSSSTWKIKQIANVIKLFMLKRMAILLRCPNSWLHFTKGTAAQPAKDKGLSDPSRWTAPFRTSFCWQFRWPRK